MSYLRIKERRAKQQQKQQQQKQPDEYAIYERLDARSKEAVVVAELRYLEEELAWRYK